MDALKHPGSPERIRKLVIRIPPYVPAPQTRRSATKLNSQERGRAAPRFKIPLN
jgi:hypothetical protein